MADRNPFIPSERRMDVESKENFTEDEATHEFAENEAELHEESADYPHGTQDHLTGHAHSSGESAGGKPVMRSMDDATSKAA